MPAFGAYAGGLNVRDRAFAEVFGSLAFTAHMLGEGALGGSRSARGAHVWAKAQARGSALGRGHASSV